MSKAHRETPLGIDPFVEKPKSFFQRYAHWLHGQWPQGTVEPLPVLDEFGETSLKGIYVTGDLTGIPLLKFASESGAKTVHHIHRKLNQEPGGTTADLLIIGAGVSGLSAAITAHRLGLNFTLIESNEPLATLENFPSKKPIYAYPEGKINIEGLHIEGDDKETLLENLKKQSEHVASNWLRGRVDRVGKDDEGPYAILESMTEGAQGILRAQSIIIAIGRSGAHRRLNVPGENLELVANQLYDPTEFGGQRVVVVGGSDSALETATALAENGAAVTLSYRGSNLTRPKAQNRDKLMALRAKEASMGRIVCEFGTTVNRIESDKVHFSRSNGTSSSVPTDAVFTMIGRSAPAAFFDKSGIRQSGSNRPFDNLMAILLVVFCMGLYHWKSYGWFPSASLDPRVWLDANAYPVDSFMHTLFRSAEQPSFYYTLAYSITVGVFGWRRIRRRKTPYVKSQTLTLVAIQWLPLFLLPELLLPWMGRNEFFVEGSTLRPLADLFFETYDHGIGVERAYWRAYGFILAWPLMVYNWFTQQPMVGWLCLGVFQTFVVIPFLVYRWGKGAYCGWICSCGALAETLGDTHRWKMPHGPKANRLNFLGQFILAAALLMMFFRIWGWYWPDGAVARNFDSVLSGPSILTYKWLIDVALAGFVSVGLYARFSGRVWCRFACPLAALMHLYARFSKFRIFAEKRKCISCNVCTRLCHQGIDVMSFANQGRPLNDPQCVRCSACVSACPTQTLRFGRLDDQDQPLYDLTPAHLMAMTEQLNDA